MKIRTFIAVSLPAEVRRHALELIARLQPTAGDVKWVDSDNLHWTLQFLGDVDDLEIPAVCHAVTTAAAEIEPFELAARGAGAFPSADRPRTLWIGAGQGAREITLLHSAIDRRLRKRGYR